jgi:hypothetical protein
MSIGIDGIESNEHRYVASSCSIVYKESHR